MSAAFSKILQPRPNAGTSPLPSEMATDASLRRLRAGNKGIEILKAPDAATARAAIGTVDATTLRTRLTASAIINVPGDFPTIAAALTYAATNLDGADHDLTIQCADSATAYVGPGYVRPTVGFNLLKIAGNSGNKRAVKLVVDPVSHCVAGFQEPQSCVISITDLDLDTTNVVGSALQFFHGNVANVNNIYWHGTSANAIAVGTTGCCNINLTGQHSIESLGSNGGFGSVGDNSFLSMEPTFIGTFVGNPAFGNFISVYRGGCFNASGGAILTNSSTATSTAKYAVQTGGVIDYFGLKDANGNATSLPGGPPYNDGTGIEQRSDGTRIFGPFYVPVGSNTVGVNGPYVVPWT